MGYTNGIKLKDTEVPPKAIAAIRKATGLSISDIKTRVSENEFLIESDLSNDSDLAKMIELAKQLDGLGLKVYFVSAGIIENVESMTNMLESHRDTARELGLAPEDI